ncbi:sugar O-acetyltransferase [Ligilactobacillus sp. LYQ135]
MRDLAAKINAFTKDYQVFNSQTDIMHLAHQYALTKCHQYNETVNQNQGYHEKLLTSLFKKCGSDLYIEPNFYCEFGFNIELGNEVFLNHDCILQDFAPITIGNQANIAPKVGFYTAAPPKKANRKQHDLIARPITLENNVWIGGNTAILGGVTIGKNSIIGAGSVVTNDIPANSIAVGNPAKVIKKLD